MCLKLYCLILSLFMVSHTFSMERYSWPEDDFFEQLYADYSERNTLPDIPFFLCSKKKVNPEPLSGYLTKVTSKDSGYLDELDISLASKRQCATGVDQKRTLSLLKGNEDDTSERGWIIHIEEEGEDKSVGFIGYHYALGVPYTQNPNATKIHEIEKKMRIEIEWFIAPVHQKKGIAHAAFEAVLSYVVKEEKLKPECLVAIIKKDNEASKGFAQKHQFKSCGVIGIQKQIEVWSRELTSTREVDLGK